MSIRSCYKKGGAAQLLIPSTSLRKEAIQQHLHRQTEAGGGRLLSDTCSSRLRETKRRLLRRPSSRCWRRQSNRSNGSSSATVRPTALTKSCRNTRSTTL